MCLNPREKMGEYIGKNEVTVIISACDEDIDTLYPFFTLLKKFWADIPSSWKILVNTETIRYEDDEVNLLQPMIEFGGKKVAWTTRLNRILRNINSEYILLILSDYFFMGNVKQDIVDKCITWMDENKEIGVFYFDTNPYCVKEESKYEGFERGRNGDSFLANAQIGLWRKEVLMELTRYKEDPWQWEQLASERTYYMKNEFYFLSENTEKVFVYDWTATGCAICARKWTKGCIELFKENNIECDFSKRGIWEETEVHPRANISWIRRAFRPPLAKRILKKIGVR